MPDLLKYDFRDVTHVFLTDLGNLLVISPFFLHAVTAQTDKPGLILRTAPSAALNLLSGIL